MTQEGIDFQLTPPGIHRRNAAERAIRTFKNHLIAGLCSTDPKFPLYLWDKLLPQAMITLNLLRGSRLNPKLSAYAQVHGPFDFNRTPLGPPGTKVLVHEKPSSRASWDPHGVEGWYIGPALDSYRCYRVWIPSTRGERDTDTLEWFPHYVKMPTASSLDIIQAAVQDIKQALQHPTKESPIDPLTDSESTALQQVISILSRLKSPSTQNSEPPAPALRVNQQPPKPAAPVLRVEPSLPEPVPVLRVAPTTPLTTIPEESPLAISTAQQMPNQDTSEQLPLVTQEEDPPTTDEIPKDHYAFKQVLQHRIAPKKCGSKYEVQIDWEHYSPSFVPINIFTSNNTNLEATKAVAQYAQQHNLLSTKGWKGFKKFLPPLETPPKHLSKPQQAFFEQALNTHRANKAIHPDTGELVEYPALLQSTDGDHWEESCCEEIGRLAQGYKPNIPTGTNTIHFI